MMNKLTLAVLSTVLLCASAFPAVYSLDSQRSQSVQSGKRAQNSQQQPAAPKASAGQQKAPSDQLTGNVFEILQFQKELNFTNDQSQAIQDMINEFDPVATKLDADVRLSRIEISKALKNEKPDFDQVREKIKLIFDSQSQIRLGMIGLYQKTFTLLTTEQRQKFLALISARKNATTPDDGK